MFYSIWRRRHVPASYRLTDGCGDIDPCCGCFLQHFARLAQKALALPRRQLPGGNHDDRYFAPLLACGKGVQKLEPVHFRHHQIEQNHGRVWMVRQPGQSQAAVGGVLHGQTHFFYGIAHHSAGIRVVLDDQDRPIAANEAVEQRRQPPPINRLGQDLDGPERKADAALRRDRDHDHRNVAEVRVAP